MGKSTRISLTDEIARLQYLANRTPEMAFSGGAEHAFAELCGYRDGAIYVGHYSGNSEWEGHARGDEIVMVLDGATTLVLLEAGVERRIQLRANELAVVPANTWHRFEDSKQLKIMTVTPQPTDHSLRRPDR
jgi:mannose-6-phosphate isomerase-like protein (cupin superfamily)